MQWREQVNLKATVSIALKLHVNCRVSRGEARLRFTSVPNIQVIIIIFIISFYYHMNARWYVYIIIIAYIIITYIFTFVNSPGIREADFTITPNSDLNFLAGNFGGI